MPRTQIGATLGVLGLILFADWTGASAQSAFSVDPLLLRLNAGANNAVLSITNPTAKDIRFEIKGFAWDQAPPHGTMQLDPTTELVIFPPLVALKAHTTQRVRVGTTTAQGPTEKSYRIMIEELPSGAAPVANQVAVRTRIGIPVFIESTQPRVSGKIDQIQVSNHELTVMFTNTGTAHTVVDDIVVRGMSGPDEVVFEDSLQGWYVLAGKSRRWEYTIKPAQCHPLKFLEIQAYVDDKMLESRLDMPAGACAP